MRCLDKARCARRRSGGGRPIPNRHPPARPKPTPNSGTGQTDGAYIGKVTLTCSDGSAFTVDASPDYDSGWSDGTQVEMSGEPGPHTLELA